MRIARAGVRWVLATIGFVLPSLMECGFSFGEQLSTQPSTQPGWQTQFLAEAPAEYARLEARVSRWELRYLIHSTQYPAEGSRRDIRQHSTRGRTIFDDRLGGIRQESKVIDVPGMFVSCVNPQYKFEAESDGRPFVISQYKKAQDETKPWTEQLREFGRLDAEQLDQHSLLRLLENGGANSPVGPKEQTASGSGHLEIKSVTYVDIDGRKCIRLDGDLIWKSKIIGIYPFWVIIDPSFHWAIRAYEQYSSGGGMRRATIEYNPAITDVAFPKRIVQEDFGLHEHLSSRSVMDFEDPRPSTAVAKDFTLESVGFERPVRKVQPRNRNVVPRLVWISGVCLVALFVWFVLYRRAKRGTERL